MAVNSFDEFDTLEPPETFCISTFPEAGTIIRERGEEWFKIVRSSLGFTAARLDCVFEVITYTTSRGLGYPDIADVELLSLVFGGDQTLASVYDERNNNNLHVVSFQKHKLLDSVRKHIERIFDVMPHP